MRGVLLTATFLALVASAAAPKERGLPPKEDRAKAEFTRTAIDAEAAYRETVLGTLTVLKSRLVDLERSTVRVGDIKEGNRIRIFRDRLARLAVEVSRHDFLGGTLPPIEKDFVPTTAKEVVEKTAGELSEAEGAYRQTLHAARAEVQELIARALQIAVDSADLDAALRAQAVSSGIDKEIETRLTSLQYTEYRFSSIRLAKNAFLIEEPEAWRVEDGELVGTMREGERLEATLMRNFKRISSVTVRGRIRSPSTHNLRMTVGPVNMALNWERAAECHFRYHEDRTVVHGNLLVPGREHEITVRQLTEQSIEACVDGRRVWITHGKLSGTITIYPYLSTIGVRELRVLGVPNEAAGFSGATHRRW